MDNTEKLSSSLKDVIESYYLKNKEKNIVPSGAIEHDILDSLSTVTAYTFFMLTFNRTQTLCDEYVSMLANKTDDLLNHGF